VQFENDRHGGAYAFILIGRPPMISVLILDILQKFINMEWVGSRKSLACGGGWKKVSLFHSVTKTCSCQIHWASFSSILRPLGFTRGDELVEPQTQDGELAEPSLTYPSSKINS